MDMLFDMGMIGVTFWKNILSLFSRVGANRFEGEKLLSRLEDGWNLVELVWKSKR